MEGGAAEGQGACTGVSAALFLLVRRSYQQALGKRAVGASRSWGSQL